MDTTIHPVSGTTTPYSAFAAKTAATGTASSPDTQSHVTTQAAAQAIAPANTGTSSDAATQQYEAALRQAALSFKNVYALGDQEFSIFKDATGKYITRYVSLRDGKVTYLPEPTLVKQLEVATGQSSAPRVAISA